MAGRSLRRELERKQVPNRRIRGRDVVETVYGFYLR